MIRRRHQLAAAASTLAAPAIVENLAKLGAYGVSLHDNDLIPHGSTDDMTEAIEQQIERFAPGFRQRILARHTMNTAAYESYNANIVGGDISGGANTLSQVMARPFLRRDPYSTPNKRIYLASSSTPPGGGVHGMCGYWAARSAMTRVLR